MEQAIFTNAPTSLIFLGKKLGSPVLRISQDKVGMVLSNILVSLFFPSGGISAGNQRKLDPCQRFVLAFAHTGT